MVVRAAATGRPHGQRDRDLSQVKYNTDLNDLGGPYNIKNIISDLRPARRLENVRNHRRLRLRRCLRLLELLPPDDPLDGMRARFFFFFL